MWNTRLSQWWLWGLLSPVCDTDFPEEPAASIITADEWAHHPDGAGSGLPSHLGPLLPEYTTLTSQGVALSLLITPSKILDSFHRKVPCFKHRSHLMQSNVKLALSIWEAQTRGVRTHRLQRKAVTQEWRKYNKGLRYLYCSPISVKRLKQISAKTGTCNTPGKTNSTQVHNFGRDMGCLRINCVQMTQDRKRRTMVTVVMNLGSTTMGLSMSCITKAL